jgi:uncharacterized membrane protein
MNTFKTCFFLIILLFVFFASAEAKDYEIPQIEAEFTIAADGTVIITEHRTYHFDGSFSWADYRLPLRGFNSIENIRVSEDGGSFMNENSEQPGTFTVSKGDETVVIQWFFDAEDQSRTFTLQYELRGALVSGNEWTEFFWTFMGGDRPKSTASFSAEISFPEPVTSNTLYFWDYTSGEKALIEIRDGVMYVMANNIGRNERVAVRMLMPAAFFDPDNNLITDGSVSLEGAQQEEEQRRQQQIAEAERREWFESITPNVVALLSVLSIGIFVLVYRRYGRRHSTATISDRETVIIPGRLAPAIIGRLLTANTTSGNQLTATIFDLSRRGWFRIKENEKEKTFFSQESSEFQIVKTDFTPQEDLSDWEKSLIDFLNMKISKGQDTFKKLFQKDASEATKWFSSWKSMVKEDFESRGWMDKESYKGVWINFLLQVPLVIASVYLLVNGGPISFILLIISVLMATASFSVIRRTPKGEEVYTRWKAYKDGLAHADERTIRMEMADKHFIYATAFHLSKKQITTLIEQTSPDSSTAIYLPWIVLMAGSQNTPASVASSLATLSSSGTTTFSGTAGGGGAVGGSAGGGASGGAG